MDDNLEKRIELASSEHAQHRRDYAEINQATINAGHRAVQALLVLSGGAAIASLGFIASLAGSDRAFLRLEYFAWPLMMFGSGAGLAVLTAGFGYFVSYCHVSTLGNMKPVWEAPFVQKTKSSERWGVTALVLTIIAWALGVASMIAFALGLYGIRDAVLTVGS